jgi:hypothetical protein
MANVKAEDMNQAGQNGQVGGDAVLLTETNARQFEGKAHVNRYVEQIKTGLFLKVKKDVDLNIRTE